MTGADHVWTVLDDGWVICTRCGVVHSSRHIALTPCRGALPPIGTHDGEQSPTSDEREIDRLRLEVARLRIERDQFERAIAALVAAADACDREAQRHPSSQSSAPKVRYLGAMARLRAVLGERRGLTALEDAREAEVDRLRRLVTAAAAALDGLLTDVEEQGFQVHSFVASHLRKLARDLRAVLDQGATR